MLITASIRDIYAGLPWWRVALGAHLATDENWALTVAARQKGRAVGYWHMVGGGLCLILVWVLATTVGVATAAAIPEPRALGMDFAFTAAFIAIVRSMWRGRADLAPWVVSFAVVALLAGTGAMDASWALILGGLGGAAAAGALGRD